MATLTHPGLGRSRSIATQAGVFLAFLVLQNILGTLVNLYVALPPGSSSFSSTFGSSPAVAAHIVVAVLLLLMSIGLVVTSRRLPDGRMKGGAWITLLGTIAAFYGGASFTFYQHSTALSLLMDIGFLIAAIGAVLVLYSAARRIGAAVPPHSVSVPVTPL